MVPPNGSAPHGQVVDKRMWIYLVVMIRLTAFTCAVWRAWFTLNTRLELEENGDVLGNGGTKKSMDIKYGGIASVGSRLDSSHSQDMNIQPQNYQYSRRRLVHQDCHSSVDSRVVDSAPAKMDPPCYEPIGAPADAKHIGPSCFDSARSLGPNHNLIFRPTSATKTSASTSLF
jgi:hypothetical protein